MVLVEGIIILLISVYDEVFVFEVMGKGLVIVLNKGMVIVFVDGIIMVVYFIGYVIGIMVNSGVEILIYIGINMV